MRRRLYHSHHLFRFLNLCQIRLWRSTGVGGSINVQAKVCPDLVFAVITSRKGESGYRDGSFEIEPNQLTNRTMSRDLIPMKWTIESYLDGLVTHTMTEHHEEG